MEEMLPRPLIGRGNSGLSRNQSCQSVGSEDLTVSRNDSNDTLSVENKLTRLSYVLLF